MKVKTGCKNLGFHSVTKAGVIVHVYKVQEMLLFLK